MWKEFRQALGWAALGLLATAFGFAVAVRQQGVSRVLGWIYTVSAVLFPVAALLVGLAHVVFENRGDRWGFFTHRPVWPSTLFLRKSFAGLVLYLIATGIPLVFTLVWIAVPRHFPAPFDWRMVLPPTADLFGGSAYYFAGVLIGMRDARWYGSRIAGIDAPVICSFAAHLSPEFWQAIAWGAVGILITGVAALGTFITGGRFETQPRGLRLATGVSVGTGLAVALVVVAIAVSVFFFFESAAIQYKTYTVTPEGTIVLTSQLAGKVVSVTDLEGKPIQQYRDPNARQWLLGNRGLLLPLRPDDAATYLTTGRFVAQMQPPNLARTTTWFYVDRLRLFGEYNNESGEIAGWLGPDGFSPGDRKPTRRFGCDPASRNDWNYVYLVGQIAASRFFVCRDVVYRIRLMEPMVDRLFEAAPGESILGGEQWGNMMQRPEYIAVSTTRRVLVAGPDGTVRFAAARDPDAAGYAAVQVSHSCQSTFLSYYPAVKFNDRVSTPPILITRFGADQTIEKRYQLPFAPLLTPASWNRVFLPWAVSSITSPLVPSLSNGRISWHGPDTILGTTFSGSSAWVVTSAESYSRLQLSVVWILSFLASIVPAILDYRRSRKYTFSAGRLTIWTGLAFVLGPIGFLLMICLLDWPVHEKCPACGRMRVVNRDLCEFCGAPFSPPPTDGTEILDLVCAPG
jgi:hypothetical protein